MVLSQVKMWSPVLLNLTVLYTIFTLKINERLTYEVAYLGRIVLSQMITNEITKFISKLHTLYSVRLRNENI